MTNSRKRDAEWQIILTVEDGCMISGAVGISSRLRSLRPFQKEEMHPLDTACHDNCSPKECGSLYLNVQA